MDLTFYMMFRKDPRAENIQTKDILVQFSYAWWPW